MTKALEWLDAEAGAWDRRVMLVYAHPDDEAIAVGGRLGRFADALFVQVTDGAPADEGDSRRLGLTRPAYRAAREAEAVAAMRAGGLAAARRVCLGMADKEAALGLGALASRVRELMRDERPEIVLTHAYEGGHADHDACAWAVRQAAEACAWGPVVVESPFYWESDAGEWVQGRFREDRGDEMVCGLSGDAQARKRAMFAAFATQREVLRGFGLEEERYRIAPRYDWSRPPGRAWYERFIPDMTADRFCALAMAAGSEGRAHG